MHRIVLIIHLISISGVVFSGSIHGDVTRTDNTRGYLICARNPICAISLLRMRQIFVLDFFNIIIVVLFLKIICLSKYHNTDISKCIWNKEKLKLNLKNETTKENWWGNKQKYYIKRISIKILSTMQMLVLPSFFCCYICYSEIKVKIFTILIVIINVK